MLFFQKVYRAYYKVALFFKDNAFIFTALFILFVVRLQISFLNYLDFKYDRYLDIEAKVVNQYLKHGKKGDYYVLKLKNDSLTFYTTSRKDLKDLLNESLHMTIVTSNVSFKEWLFTFYAPSFNLKLLPVSKIEEYIEKQHSNKKDANIFKALFLAQSIDYQTRNELSTLGVSHLIALSGLHLGFISLFLYVLLSGLYRMIQKRFPYRNRFVDLGIVVFIIEFAYLYITGFPPSLIRAYILEVVVFLYAYYLQNPFSLKVLGVVFLVSLLLFGQKVFSIGYFLSITGVFYIYLFFRYYRPSLINSLILSFYMFCMMFVISHTLFGNFNMYQLFSPFVNILFTVFYPLEILLHISGFGGLLDGLIERYLHLGVDYDTFKLPVWGGVVFLALSVLAFFSKRAFYGINLLSIITILFAIGASFV